MSWKRRIALLAGVAAGALALLAGVGSAVSSAVPSNTSLPSISGAARDGSVLFASHGTWTNGPTSFAYTWQRCDTAGGSCSAIAGATSRRYTLTSADVGHRVRVVVTASNGSGSGTAASRPTDVVQASGQAPKNTVAPTIAGAPKEGTILTVRHGAWTGTKPITFGYQWQRCDATSGTCSNIAGATGTTYTATAADVGSVLRVNVTATNSRGSTVATTPETDIVAPATPAGGAGHTISVTKVSLPNRLVVDRVKFSPFVLRSRHAFVARFHVSDTRGFSIQGALVYALGLPYGWTHNAPELATDNTGWATIQMRPTRNLPLRPGALVVFVRARKPGDNLLAGVSTRRLVQVSIR
jgi:Ig domain of plant-specific actin-binding protein